MRPARVWITTVLVAATPASAPAQPSPCDTTVNVLRPTTLTYQRRDGRCEGEYGRNVGSRLTYFVASYELRFDEYTGREDTLVVRWPRVFADSIRLIVEGMFEVDPYRMDVVLTDPAAAFRWPTDILSSSGMVPAELGVLASVPLPFADPDTPAGDVPRYYVPVSLASAGRAAAGGSAGGVCDPVLEIKTDSDFGIERVTATLRRYGLDGTPGALVWDDQDLEYYSYPDPIPIYFDEVAEPGLYRIDVGIVERPESEDAPRRSGSLHAWILHPGAGAACPGGGP